MLAHKTSQYYGLETSTAEAGEYAGRIVAVRTASSARPRPMRLSDLKLPDGASLADALVGSGRSGACVHLGKCGAEIWSQPMPGKLGWHVSE